MKFSAKKLKEFKERYMYSSEFVFINPLFGFIILSNPFLIRPLSLPRILTSYIVSYNYYKKLFSKN